MLAEKPVYNLTHALTPLPFMKLAWRQADDASKNVWLAEKDDTHLKTFCIGHFPRYARVCLCVYSVTLMAEYRGWVEFDLDSTVLHSYPANPARIQSARQKQPESSRLKF